MTLLFKATIRGSPGDAAINRARRAVRTARGGTTTIKSRRARAFESRAAAALEVARIRNPTGFTSAAAAAFIEVRVLAYWPRARRLPGTDGTLAHGDVDAPVKAVLDALERSGLVDDDARVCRVVATKAVDRERPRIEVRVFAASAPSAT